MVSLRRDSGHQLEDQRSRSSSLAFACLKDMATAVDAARGRRDARDAAATTTAAAAAARAGGSHGGGTTPPEAVSSRKLGVSGRRASSFLSEGDCDVNFAVIWITPGDCGMN